MKTALPPFEILIPGSFTSAEGDAVTFSAADLAAIVDAYDYDTHPAPIVLGHPKMDDPAQGWITGLKIEGDAIVATVGDLEPSFAEAVSAKRYRRVSPQLYPPRHPGNPKPGAGYLKHVGFLGAAAPAIKALKPVNAVSFAESEQAAFITAEMELQMDPKTTEADAAKEQSFAEREAKIAADEASLAERERHLKDEQARLDKLEADGRRAAAVSFAEAQVTAGKLAPAAKERVAFLHETLGSIRTVSFGEGDAAETPDAALRALFDNAAPIVSFGEFAKPEREDGAVVSFAAPAGHTVDPAALEVHGKAIALQAENKGLSYLDAVKQASA